MITPAQIIHISYFTLLAIGMVIGMYIGAIWARWRALRELPPLAEQQDLTLSEEGRTLLNLRAADINRELGGSEFRLQSLSLRGEVLFEAPRLIHVPQLVTGLMLIHKRGDRFESLFIPFRSLEEIYPIPFRSKIEEAMRKLREGS